MYEGALSLKIVALFAAKLKDDIHLSDRKRKQCDSDDASLHHIYLLSYQGLRSSAYALHKIKNRKCAK